ncbi:MAG: hypothetical protein OEL20_12825 [Sulfuritalea sp.]|nr:hypothetical protein [Sulfuritalea sp.]
MKMIFGDEIELEHVLDLIRQDDQTEPDTEPMPTARYLAGLLRAGLIADGVEAHQIADTSDIVNWFLVYESPRGSWHRAYAQCLATLMIYFFKPSGPLTAATDRLARAADLLRLEDECGHVLMADRLRMATEEVGRQLEKTWLWFERTNDALIDVSDELRTAKKQAGTDGASEAITAKLQGISDLLESIKPSIEKTAVGVAALQPKETDRQKAGRLMESLKRERGDYVARGEKFTAVGFQKRWAVKEGCSADNIKRLLALARKQEGQSGPLAPSKNQFSALANFKKGG